MEDINKDIKILEEIKDMFIYLKNYGWINDIKKDIDTDKAIQAIENIINRNKELEEELKEEKELNKIIKNTKLDEIFTRPRRNGKTIELAMRLREEILKLPECKLYGIKNCKNKVVLLTKEECIPVSLVEEKIEELNKEEQELQDSISDEEREEYSDANISYQLMDIEVKRSVLQELLEKRK